MNLGDKIAYGILTATIAGSVWGFNYLQPNEGQARFRGDTITVNVDALKAWNVDPAVLNEWDVPVEFVKGEADVNFTLGETSSTFVEGYGTLYVAGETNCEMNSRRWLTGCTIVLSTHDTPAPREAAAIVTHEFGHALGAQHDDSQDSIMGTVMPSKQYTPRHWSWSVTDDDRAQLPY